MGEKLTDSSVNSVDGVLLGSKTQSDLLTCGEAVQEMHVLLEQVAELGILKSALEEPLT